MRENVRKVMVALLDLVHALMLFSAVLTAVVGFSFWIETPPTAIAIDSLILTIWFTGAMVPVFLARWWLKVVSWGSFAELAFMLAIGFFHSGTYILKFTGQENFLVGVFFWWMSWMSCSAAVEFVMRSYRQSKALMDARRRTSKKTE